MQRIVCSCANDLTDRSVKAIEKKRDEWLAPECIKQPPIGYPATPLPQSSLYSSILFDQSLSRVGYKYL